MIKPFSDFVVVQEYTPEENKTASGLIIQSSGTTVRKAVVLDFGTDGGYSVAQGDVVYLDWTKAYRLNENTYAIREDDIIAKDHN